MPDFYELSDEKLDGISGGLSRQEVIDHLNKNWAIIPEDMRNKIIEVYTESGPTAAYKLVQRYIENSHMDYLTPLLDLFNQAM